MANEINVFGLSGSTCYAFLRNAAGQFRKVAAQAFEAWDPTHRALYAIALVEKTSYASGLALFAGDLPAGLDTKTVYPLDVFVQAGGSPAAADALFASGSVGDQLGISGANLTAVADTSGTTTLLNRVTAQRAGNLDNLDATISSRSTYAGADTSGTSTLLARVTSARAGYLDNLNVSGPVAAQADVLNLHNNTALSIDIPMALERPDSGTFVFSFTIVTRNDGNALADADSLPGVAVANQSGTDRSASLSALTRASTGEYTFNYTLSATDAIEELKFRISCTIGGRPQLAVRSVQVVDTTAVDFTLADRTTLNAIAGALPANLSALAITIGGAVTVGANNDKTGYSLSQAFPTNFAALAITAGGAVTAGSVSDKAGYALAATGLNAVPVDTKPLPIALQLIAAATAGKLSGAGTSTEIFVGLDGTTTRLTASVDSDGNRTAITYG